jgi:hypothetical protein
MKLSERLRDRKWKLSLSASSADEYKYNDDATKAADLLDECEDVIRSLLSIVDKVDPGAEAASQSVALVRARVALSKLEDGAIEGEVKIFYRRENDSLRPLPLDIDAAIDSIREEFIAGHTHGSLCSIDENMNDFVDVLPASRADRWDDFEFKAREWLARHVDVASRKKGHKT